MNLILPLGLLGLLGIAVLIIIYLLKPNYQQKIISSTFVWKLSLKYRKKKIPINKLRNLIILICQILIIVSCALILAQPVIVSDTNNRNEKIIVIDASASMLAVQNDETRFERAVSQVKEVTKEVLSQNGTVSIILADDAPSFLAQQSTGSGALNDVLDELDGLVVPDKMKCSYGQADIDGAMSLAETVLEANPKAEVVLYTATKYTDKGRVTVVDVSKDGEWNAAVLNCVEVLDENFYSFTVDVACYGRNLNMMVFCDIYGANIESKKVELAASVNCEDDKTQTITFYCGTADNQPEFSENIQVSDTLVYSYEYVRVYVVADDSLVYDNEYYLYGGTKETLRVEYFSTKPNTFFSSILMGIRDLMRPSWAIELTEISDEKKFELSGYDVYIFEHKIPAMLPTDGVVLLVNPDQVPMGIGLGLGSTTLADGYLSKGGDHPILNHVSPENIYISQYKRIALYDGYEPLMYYNDDPVFLVRNDVNSKIAVLSFSLNQADFSLLPEFPLLMYNFFRYYLPATFSGYVYDVGDTISFNARGPVLTVTAPGINNEFTNFPGQMKLTVPGIYTAMQTPLSGREVFEYFFVKIPSAESNICRTADVLTNPYFETVEETADYDLLVYLAAALVALLFLEWILQARDQF